MRIQTDGNTLQISGIQELCAANASLFQQNTLNAFASGLAGIEVDLSGALAIDCAGLGVLLALDRACQDRSGALRLRNPSPPVAQILELTRADQVLQIVCDEQ